jgi:tetratricopeptide (TPR) repeat protein
MSIIDRILGRTLSEGPQILAPGKPAAANPGPIKEPPAAVIPVTERAATTASEGVIRVYDQFGRKVEIGRAAWRTDVLLPNLKAQRNNPDALYDLILSALNDDFAEDVLESARFLAEHDPKPQRGAVVLGAVLLQLKDHEGARAFLESAIARHGENSYLLANLARAHAADGDDARAQALIWHSLQLEPNDETSLNWMISMANAKGGQDAVLAAYARAAALPGSWRPQLWLARHALTRGDLAEATRLYEEVLARVKPVPADLLMQMSGDLGNGGHTELLVRLTQPRFDLNSHGLTVGNNLLRGYVDLGMFAEARKLLEQLYSLQRPDWREHLIHWEQKLDDAEKRYGEVSAPLEVVVMKLDQPVWARGVLGFDSVLPAKTSAAPRIHFVCGSGEASDDVGGKVVSQPTNDLGRIARALPMFLAEELYLRTNARTAFLLPWMKQGGFILSAKPWTRAFLPPDQMHPDLIVFLHVDARVTPWLLKVTIETTQRAVSPVAFEQAFALQTAGHDALTLLYELIPRLTSLLALRREESNSALGTPPADLLPGYLAAIEQALAIGLAARQTGGESFLHQERSIFDHLFDVALHGEQLLRPRMLLVNALENQTRRRPDIAREYLEKLALLQKRHALPLGVGGDLVAKAVAVVIEKANIEKAGAAPPSS